jgi:hypothetical protein
MIEFQDRNHAIGVWAMEDNLFWLRNGEKQWIRSFGFYHEICQGCRWRMALQLSPPGTHSRRDIRGCKHVHL